MTAPAPSSEPLGPGDLDAPTLTRVAALLAAGDAVGADLVLRRFDAAHASGDAPAETPDASMLRVRVAMARQDPVRIAHTAAAQLQRTPARPDLRLARVQACFVLARLDEALATVQSIRVPPSHPLMPQVRWWHARILVRARRFDEARAVLLALAAMPGSRAIAESILGEIEMLEGDLPAARRRLEALVADQSADLRPRREAAFTLARVCDRLDDPEAAFAAAATGHALRPAPFDADAFDREVNAIIARFDASWFESAPISSVTSQQPVLIVGLPRSGTSLLEQIIASHSRAGGVGERQDPFRLIEDIERVAELRGGEPTSRDLDLEAEAYLQMHGDCGVDRDRVVNKALGLERTLGWMARILPGARVIRLGRDPRDTLLSIHQHPLSPRLYPWAGSLDHLVRIQAAFTRLMDHWAETLPIPMLEMRYESLVDDQAGETARLLAFLGLESDASCLRFHESDRVVLTPSHDQVRKPMNRDGIGRWQRYTRHLGPVLAAHPPSDAPPPDHPSSDSQESTAS